MFLDDIVGNVNNSIFRYNSALTYLKSRGVTEEDIKRYLLGFSRIIGIPNDNTSEYKRFVEESWKGKKFERLIIFPIQNALGNVIGIVGRSLETKMFKVFVTEESKFTGFFFGFYQALPHIYETGRAFVVEGAFDCIAFSKVYPNVVSTVTAGLYPNQYRLLSFYCKNIITVFDADEPGQNAAEIAERKKGVLNLKLGYKDPAHCYETLGFKKFKMFLEKKVKTLPPVWD